MSRNLGKVDTSARAIPRRPFGNHALLDEPALGARDCVCGLGSSSPTLEGAYPRARVAVVLAGTFHVRSSAGHASLGPGAMLLGNAAAAYEFRHLDDGGDRTMVFEYEEALLDEIARSFPARPRAGVSFRRASVPASPAATEAVVLTQEALRDGDVEALREAALVAAGLALNAGDQDARDDRAWSPAQARRVARSLRYLEANSAGDCSLEALATEARLGRCQFLRLFRAMTGQTPRQHVIAIRLRAAATGLRTTRAPITDIALEAGFGDLSHFTTLFSRTFGRSPRAYRNREPAR